MQWRAAHQYKTSSPHSTSNLKCEKATGVESASRASRYHALSSFISSLFSLSFQPHSLCSYLQQKKRQTVNLGRVDLLPIKRRTQESYSACMLALVSSKAHSTASGFREVTLLHSICRFSLGETTSSRQTNKQTSPRLRLQNKSSKQSRTRFCRTFWRLGTQPGGPQAARRKNNFKILPQQAFCF